MLHRGGGGHPGAGRPALARAIGGGDGSGGDRRRGGLRRLASAAPLDGAGAAERPEGGVRRRLHVAQEEPGVRGVPRAGAPGQAQLLGRLAQVLRRPGDEAQGLLVAGVGAQGGEVVALRRREAGEALGAAEVAEAALEPRRVAGRDLVARPAGEEVVERLVEEAALLEAALRGERLAG